MRVDAVPVLHADHRGDGLCLGQVFRCDAGDSEVADQPRLAQLGQRAEVLGDGLLAHDAQVDDVEVVAAQLAQVLLDLTAQFVGPRRSPPRA